MISDTLEVDSWKEKLYPILFPRSPLVFLPDCLLKSTEHKQRIASWRIGIRNSEMFQYTVLSTKEIRQNENIYYYEARYSRSSY